MLRQCLVYVASMLRRHTNVACPLKLLCMYVNSYTSTFCNSEMDILWIVLERGCGPYLSWISFLIWDTTNTVTSDTAKNETLLVPGEAWSHSIWNLQKEISKQWTVALFLIRIHIVESPVLSQIVGVWQKISNDSNPLRAMGHFSSLMAVPGFRIILCWRSRGNCILDKLSLSGIST